MAATKFGPSDQPYARPGPADASAAEDGQGEDLGIPLGTVKSWCRRGLMTLKRSLADLVDT